VVAGLCGVMHDEGPPPGNCETRPLTNQQLRGMCGLADMKKTLDELGG
jgi:hypothetical protein